MESINSEILTLTYGGIVRQLIADHENVAQVNSQLKKMGRNIGHRLIDEYLAVTKTRACVNFTETAEKVATVGMKIFLNASATISEWSPEGTACTIVIQGNPLADFVQLPDDLQSLQYNNIICGVIEGALEMINIQVECESVKDILQGDASSEIRMVLIESKAEQYPFKEDE